MFVYSKNGLKTWHLYIHYIYIDIIYHNNYYTMPHKADPTVFCQCGAVNKYYMPKHIQTAKHARGMIRMYAYMYVC